MKTIILAGGKGLRIAEESTKIPKPMIKIGNLPIIIHIIKIYQYYGFNDFIICGGYKYKIIKKFFEKKKLKINVKIINTGINTNTGGRILKIKKYLKNDKNFFLTYGDGLSDVNINKIYHLHKIKKKIVTLTAVKPHSKFGVVKFLNNNSSTISRFTEKPRDHFISGGFFVLSNKIFKYLKNSKTIFEFDCLPLLAKKRQVVAYRHKKFWRCLDTMKDKYELNKIWKTNRAPWKK